MTKLHRPFVFFLVGVLLVNTCPLAEGQTKFSTWLRERVGERKTKDPAKAEQDIKWQKEHFASPEAKAKFVAAVKGLKSKCYVCHLKGEKKEVRNPYGAELSALLRSQLKMEGKAITAALKSSAPETDREKVEKAFYECLDKSLKKPVDPKAEQSGTYGGRVEKGELPFAP